ncbi:MAG: glycine/sarcosine/betaine reductase complex component C subunit beta [Dehalococcoidia bacterium]
MSVVIKETAYVLNYVPDFVQYGSKPSRDIPENEGWLQKIKDHLRSYEDAVNYAPNQVFIGNKHPDELTAVPKPWYEHPLQDGKHRGSFGEIMHEDEFYGWMKIADDFDLLWLYPQFVDQIRDVFAAHPFIGEAQVKKLGEGTPLEKIRKIIEQGAAVPVYFQGKMVGSMRRDHDKDDTLKSLVLMENLMAKASGSLAMLHLFNRAGIAPTEVDFVLDCTETAIGDRYNRGGGSMSKAMAEMTGCVNATGNDIRAFCCAPNHAIINAAALVGAGIFNNVVVAGGGCLAKLGMKSEAHIKHNMPILEDVLGAIAFLITKDDGKSPVIRLDSVGKHDVGAGSSQQAIMTSLIIKPLAKLGMKMTDIDKYSTELHNPEITLPAASGDTPATNYKIMAALAVLNKQIDKADMEQFVKERGMPGFCPTQGHVPSSVPFLGHAIEAMKRGEMKNAMFVAKGSLFLGRMSQLSDGLSFLLEANPNSGPEN